MYRDYEEGDIIRIKNKDGEYVYLTVDFVEDDGVFALSIEDKDDEYCDFYGYDTIEYIEPTVVDREKLKQFARLEISFDEVCGDTYPKNNIKCEPRYNMRLDDILAAIENVKKTSVDLESDWIVHLYDLHHKAIALGPLYYDAKGIEGFRNIPSENYWVRNELDKIHNILIGNESGSLEEESEHIEKMIIRESLPVTERDYPDGIKREYIDYFENDRILNSANDNELALFVKYTNELANSNDVRGLEIKAYSCYGGNRSFPCDWIVSRDCLLKLIELKDNGYYANTLGYIYYYGRCNNGEPEYDNAFKYFSIGAAAGIYESRYKISDMLRHGYGVPKNEKAALTIIEELYEENLKYMQRNFLDNKFADVALRLGSCFENGTGVEKDADSAYYYYLQADFAIRMRMLDSDHYGDTKVAAGIKESIERILPETSFAKRKTTVHSSYVSHFLRNSFKKNRRVEAKIKKLKTGQYSIRFTQIPKANETYRRKMFITVPEAHFCGLVESITVNTTKIYNIKINGKKFNGDKATVVFDRVDWDVFTLYGERVLELDAEYKIKFNSQKEDKKYRFVSVEFNPGEKTYDYICEDENIKIGDVVSVDTKYGTQNVTVVRIFEKTESETALPIGKYKKIQKKTK